MLDNPKELSDILNIPSPIDKVDVSHFVGFDKEIYVKRDDLIHPVISGNKWRKLKYNIQEAKDRNYTTILTFGGAFSNHIAASAYAVKAHGLKSIGVIRGEAVENRTLKLAKQNGMQFYFVSRADYRLKQNDDFILKLKRNFGQFYHIPEGGANPLGVLGAEEIISEIENFDFDVVALSAGTGTTAAGILKSIDQSVNCIVFPALKKGSFLEQEIVKLSNTNPVNLSLELDFHFGGYAKTNAELIQFMRLFYKKTNLKLDQVYTAKMMFGLLEKIKNGAIPSNAKILVIHTGGLQGNTKIEFD